MTSEAEPLYLDTSALLPYYRQEPLSDHVQELLSRLRQPPQVSTLTEVEFASALSRWVRMGELRLEQSFEVEQAFREDLAAGLYRVGLPSSDDYRQAYRWLAACSTSLRTLDALHLAYAHRRAARLITADRVLSESAGRLGIPTYLLA